MEIKEINISGVSIPDVTIVDPRNYSSPPIPVAPPVTVNTVSYTHLTLPTNREV